MVDRHESQAISKQYDSSVYEGKYEEVKQKFESFNPGPINEACNLWSQVAKKLGDLAGTIHADAGVKLSDAWDSAAATDAQHQLQVAQATAAALADQCMQMARATDAAYQYVNWYKTNFPGTGTFTTHADHQRAVEHEVHLLERYNEVISILPSQVQAQYTDTHPNSTGRDDFTRTGAAGGVGGLGALGPGGGLPGGGGAPHLPGSGTPHLPGGSTPHVPGGGGGSPVPGGGGVPGGGAGGFGSPYDTGSALAGGGGAGGIGAGLGPDGLGAGGIGSGAGGVGSGLGSGAGGIGSGLGSGAGGPGSGAGAFGPGGPGAGGRGGRFGVGEPEGAGGRGAGGRGAAGAGGTGAMPVHGQRGDKAERERTTWLTEDEDVWGGDTDAPPPVIGG